VGALDFRERTFPGASLVLDLGVHAPAFADLNADHVATAGSAAIAVRARISRQLTDQEDRIVGGRVPVQEPGNKSTCTADLITAPGKGEGTSAQPRRRDVSGHHLIAHSSVLAVLNDSSLMLI
jgi:hypothetical protein